METAKVGIVNFLCGNILDDNERYFLLVIASADTRFSIASPALSESGKIASTIDYLDPDVFIPFYDVFLGKNSNDPDKKIQPCNARIGHKILSNLVKVRGKGINTTKGIQVVFEGVFGVNTNRKCKILSLQFCENVIR